MKKFFQIFALCIVVIAGTAASNPNARFNDLGHKMICTCGCGQVLLECNHYGCPSLTQMTTELRTSITRGDTDAVILNAFGAEYGPTVFASPIRGGFDRVAWITPIVVFAAATFLAIWLIRRWRLKPVAGAPAAHIQQNDPMRDRIRRDTEEL
jgi:cytochrome c-type biogenesis protein CcmH